MDRNSNMIIEETLIIDNFREKILWWYEHVQRRLTTNLVVNIRTFMVERMRRKTHPIRKWEDCVRLDMKKLDIVVGRICLESGQ